MNAKIKTWMGILSGMLTFRVVLALVVSTSVTTAVSGPLAYQAHKARNADIAAPSDVAPPPSGPRATTTPTTTSTTTTTTTQPSPSMPATEPEVTTPLDPPSSTSSTTAPRRNSPTTTSRPAATTTTAPVGTPVVSGPDGIYVSNYASHRARVPLNGAKVGGTVWVFFDEPGVSAVRYWLNDPSGYGTPVIETTAPFDLAADGFAFSTLEPGSHTLLVEATTSAGTIRRLATFSVIAID